MDQEHEHELAKQKADALAFRIVLIGLLRSLRNAPDGQRILKETFSYAEHFSTVAAVKLGGPETGFYSSRIAEVVEHIRASVIKDQGKPKGVI